MVAIWTAIESRASTLTADKMAELLGVTPEELEATADPATLGQGDLADTLDGLADTYAGGFRRECIEVSLAG